MKLIELEIHETRGIRDLRLTPGGRNSVVWGPNGSGKSAVVDAIDFLLTGRISRLMGKGTGGITLPKYGPHVDHRPEEAIVKAVIELPGTGQRVAIQRCMAKPGTLSIEGTRGPYLDKVLEIAKRGQHVLTRREILRYITAEGSSRAEQIQELLDLREVEEIRKALVRVAGDLTKAVPGAQSQLTTARAAVSANIGEREYRPETVLAQINRYRQVLRGEPIGDLNPISLKVTLVPPAAPGSSSVINKTLFAQNVSNIQLLISPEAVAAIKATDRELQDMLQRIRTSPMMLRDLARSELTTKGLGLLDETGACPLCDTPWAPGELRTYLEKRLENVRLATQYNSQIATLAGSLSRTVAGLNANLSSIVAASRATDAVEAAAELGKWMNDLQTLGKMLVDPVQNYHPERLNANGILPIVAPVRLQSVLTETALAITSSIPDSTPEQDAWDTLTRLEENLKALQNAERSLSQAVLRAKAASVLYESYQLSRDAVLKRLYDGIKDRFVELYRDLHGSDEDQFDAKLEPDGAALNLEVDFRGRGTHPPQALHSEGHQDSMGLCLYLALAEQLGQGKMKMIVLDDVVMSVDADHRRSLCALLSSKFPDYQFVITTHDKTWATQLKSEGVVKTREYTEFYNWHVDTGPLVNCEADLWDRMKVDLERNDVPAAAARLRRGSEEYFATVCDRLEAQVPFKLSGRWELGDFMPAAIGKYRELVKKAKVAEQSWGYDGAFQMFQELDSVSAAIVTRTQSEQWGINASVHYNTWATLLNSDFQPIVEAFQDLFALFSCSQCGSLLRIAKEGPAPVAVRCACGKVNWNLTSKTKTK